MVTDFLHSVIGVVPAGYEYLEYTFSFFILTIFVILTLKFFLSIFSRFFQ